MALSHSSMWRIKNYDVIQMNEKRPFQVFRSEQKKYICLKDLLENKFEMGSDLLKCQKRLLSV